MLSAKKNCLFVGSIQKQTANPIWIYSFFHLLLRNLWTLLFLYLLFSRPFPESSSPGWITFLTTTTSLPWMPSNWHYSHEIITLTSPMECHKNNYYYFYFWWILLSNFVLVTLIFWWYHRRLQTRLWTSVLIISQLKFQILVFISNKTSCQNLRTGIAHLHVEAVRIDAPAVQGCNLSVFWWFPMRYRDQTAVSCFLHFRHSLFTRYCQSLPKIWPQYQDNNSVKSHVGADRFLSNSLLFSIYIRLSIVFHIMWPV
jgi:hypothetical protein